MPDAIEYQEQTDFSAGSFPGMERVPPNGVEKCLNGLITDDGAIERRGGLGLKTTGLSVFTTPPMLWAGYLNSRLRTVMVGSHAYTLASDDTTAVDLGAISDFSGRRPVEIANMALSTGASPTGRNRVLVYGGADASKATYTTGTMTVTSGSKDVTGAGTSWSANVRPGQVLSITRTTTPPHHAAAVTYNFAGVIASVNSNTSLTLVDEWAYGSPTASTYSIADVPELQLEPLSATGPRAVLCATMGKLFAAQGNKIFESGFELADDIEYPAPLNFNTLSDFHLLPAGALVLGMQAIGSNVLVFTSAGVWMLTNVAFDITDDFGNPQQQLEQVSQDIVLWGDLGIASWEGRTIVPSLSDLYLVSGDGQFEAVTGGARALYRSYVKAGYAPGQAAVYRGHYFLPILNGLTLVTTMVWRLDMPGVPFTQWDFQDFAPLAYVHRPGTVPALLAHAAVSLLDMTGCLEPPSGDLAELPTFDVTSRTLSLSGTREHTWRAVRSRWDVTAADDAHPSVVASYSTAEPGTDDVDTDGALLMGDTPSAFYFAIRARLFRVRLQVVPFAAVDHLTLRQIEVGVRRSGAV